jgi:hypothetical protein
MEAERMSFGWLHDKHEIAVEIERHRAALRMAESPDAIFAGGTAPSAETDALFSGKIVRRRL